MGQVVTVPSVDESNDAVMDAAAEFVERHLPRDDSFRNYQLDAEVRRNFANALRAMIRHEVSRALRAPNQE